MNEEIPTPRTDAAEKAHAEYCDKVTQFFRAHNDIRDFTSEQLEKGVGKCPHQEYETARTLERENVQLREDLIVTNQALRTLLGTEESAQINFQSYKQLTKERDDLKAVMERVHEVCGYSSVRSGIKACEDIHLMQINNLEKQVLEHRAFLNALQISHDLDVPEEVWSELFADPSSIKAKWVKREVLEKCVEALETVAQLPTSSMYPDGPCLTKCDKEEVKEALTLARAELGKEKSA